MKARFCITVLIALGLSWCAGNGLYPVSGKVTYRGAPAADAAVFLYRKGADPLKEQTIMGIVQPDGSFTLDTGALGKGAPPGEYDVVIEWKEPAKAGVKGAGARLKSPDKLKGRYADPKRPRLFVVVKPAANELAAFDLTE